MNLPRSQFGLKTDLPVRFPYRFNSSIIVQMYLHEIKIVPIKALTTISISNTEIYNQYCKIAC